ncbi:hypothetical protein [Luteitalea sp.]
MIESAAATLFALVSLVGLAIFAKRMLAPARQAEQIPASPVPVSEAAEQLEALIARLEAAEAAALASGDMDAMRAVVAEVERLRQSQGLRGYSTNDLSVAIAKGELKALFESGGQGAERHEGHTVWLKVHAEFGRDVEGALLFTSRAVTFIGDAFFEIEWPRVVHVNVRSAEEGMEVFIQERGKRRPTKFRTWDYLHAELIGDAAARLRVGLTSAPGKDESLPDSKPSGARPPADDDDDLDFETDVVGESHDGRQDSLWAIAKRSGQHPSTGVRFTARLTPEPDNPVDACAVAIEDHVTGAMLGYLSRRLARSYHAAVASLAARGPVTVPGLVRGGREPGHSLGAWLDLTAFNAAVGLPPPETFTDTAAYFAKRTEAGSVDGVAWHVHRSHAIEAAKLGQDEAAAASFEKALQGWLGAMAFESRPPGAAALFEEYARWCRKAKREDLEREVLRRYADHVAGHEQGCSRHARLTKRHDVLVAAY